MLISHRHKFIFLKTNKTASTSVEIFFEPECFPEEQYPGPRHSIEQYVSEAGVVGARKPDTTASEWFNHMPAAAVRAKVGQGTWSEYLKFCVVRNPFDKVVSWWWHQMSLQAPNLDLTDDRQIQRAFNAWVLRTTDMMMDRDKYVIDGQICVDQFLRYESLRADLETLCHKLGLRRSVASLGEYKRGNRRSAMPFASYYEPPAAAKVATWFQWEVENFGYTLRPSDL